MGALAAAFLCVAPQARASLVELSTSLHGSQVTPDAASPLEMQAGPLRLVVRSDEPVARFRLIGSGDTCPIGREPDVDNGDDPSTADDDALYERIRQATFDLNLPADSSCTLTVNAWHENFRWAGRTTLELSAVANDDDPPSSDPSRRQDITRGTEGTAAMVVQNATVDPSGHGVRVYCSASHLSYDDPIVHPDLPGAAHLHLFWGNTGADAFSDVTSLATSGRASCEGGRNNRSSYWAPVLFDAAGQATLPESIFVYYKSHPVSAIGFDRNTIRAIPEGLQMLATRGVMGGPGVKNVTDGSFRIASDGSGGLHMSVLFPQCVAEDAQGRPVLSSEDDVAHLAYQSRQDGRANQCPASHPYRIPQVSYILRYAVPHLSDWRLASDHDGMPQGASLHADYFASWDTGTMEAIVSCNRRMHRSCRFQERLPDGTVRVDTQLPERLRAPDGSPVYRYSTVLVNEVDRTPYGTSLTPMRP